MRLSLQDLALALAVVAVLGFSFVPIKVGLREIPAFSLAALRFFLASVPLVFFVSRPRISWWSIAGYGFAIGVCQFGLLFLGLQLGMSAGLSSLVIQVQVFFTIGLGVSLLGDTLRPRNVAGAIVATAGIALLGAYKLRAGEHASFAGFWLVIVAAVSWSAGNVIAKRAAKRDPDMLALVVWSSLVPPLPLAALAYLFEGGVDAWLAIGRAGALTWACVTFMAWGATLFGFASWARLLHRYPTALISPFALLIPVAGLASGALFLGETLSPMQLGGAILVLAGLVVNLFGFDVRVWGR